MRKRRHLTGASEAINPFIETVNFVGLAVLGMGHAGRYPSRAPFSHAEQAHSLLT